MKVEQNGSLRVFVWCYTDILWYCNNRMMFNILLIRIGKIRFFSFELGLTGKWLVQRKFVPYPTALQPVSMTRKLGRMEEEKAEVLKSFA